MMHHLPSIVYHYDSSAHEHAFMKGFLAAHTADADAALRAVPAASSARIPAALVTSHPRRGHVPVPASSIWTLPCRRGTHRTQSPYSQLQVCGMILSWGACLVRFSGRLGVISGWLDEWPPGHDVRYHSKAA